MQSAALSLRLSLCCRDRSYITSNAQWRMQGRIRDLSIFSVLRLVLMLGDREYNSVSQWWNKAVMEPED